MSRSSAAEAGTEGISFGDVETPVLAWAVGRLSQEGRVSCILFGQFAQDRAPPADGWIFIGRNVIQDIHTADKERKSQSQEEDVPKSKITSSENDLYEDNMDTCRRDKMRVEVMKTQAVLPGGGPSRDAAATAPILRVAGCALGGVNGRYIEAGTSGGCMRFRNVKGWVIFRQELREIPELGIYADSCYDAFKGPSMRDLLDRRAEFAATDLLRSEVEGGCKEGTAGFKRRFLEVSRAGSRMVMGDQQTALIRDEQTKAQLRTQADIRMLQLISAIEAGGDAQRGGVKLKPLSRSLSSMSAPGNIDDNIDFQLGKSRNIQSQTLSLSMLPGKSISGSTGSQKVRLSKYAKEEAELSLHVTKAIALREIEISRLSLEAADLNRSYMELDEAGSDREASKEIIQLGLEGLFSQMAAVRSASIAVAEALGAWSRFVMMQRRTHADKVATDAAMGMSADPREGRRYCVAIAVRGAPLYPKSKPLVSSNSRACRGEEPEKLALDIKYAGIFDKKSDAIEAYRQACIGVPIENRVMPYVDAPPMYIGLRICGQHYLVRSDFVPPKLPCEQCTAAVNAQPKLLVPSMASTLGVDSGITADGNSKASHNQITLPQFIWHGVNYIDKMWSDLDFLGGVDALRRYQCDIDPYMNPLLLPKDELKEFYGTLNEIHATNSKTTSGKDLKVVQRLKGRAEQLADAKAASAWNKDDRTGFEHMGVAYRVPNMVPNLNRMQDYIPSPGKSTPRAAKGSTALVVSQHVSQSNYQILEDISTLPGPLAPRVKDQDSSNGVQFMNGMDDDIIEAATIDPTALISCQPASPFGKSIPISATEEKRSALAATAEAAALGRSLSRKYLTLDSTRSVFGSTALSFTGDALFNSDMTFTGSVVGPEKGSVMRALSILSQSEVADPFQFEDDVLAHITAIQKKTIQAPKGAFSLTESAEKMFSKTAPVGGEVRRRRKGDPSSVEEYPAQYQVKAAYDFHGARFETVQTRNALANRTRTTWCRSDVGEWAGLSTKGPNMKAWEHRDRALTNARQAAEKRKEMQHMIRAAICFDFISCDVPWITELISRAQSMKGSVLGLDIMQAELFLKNRLRAIAACRKIQSWRRGLVSRRIVRELRAMIKRARVHRFVTETEASKFAKIYIPEMLSSVARTLTSRLSASLISFTINLRGISVIANVHAMARNSKKSRALCYSCRLAPGAATKRFDAGLHKNVRDRVPCTCRYFNEPEKWLLKIYEPLSSYSFQRVFTIAEIRSLLRSTHDVESFKPEDHFKRVITPSAISSLDDIKTQLELGPLYRLLLRPPNYQSSLIGTENNAVRIDAAVAWLRAQKEGAAMALQMPGMSLRLQAEIMRPELSPNLADFFIHNNKYETILQTRQIGLPHSHLSNTIDRNINKHTKTISVVGSFAHSRHFALTELLSQKYEYKNEFRPLFDSRAIDRIDMQDYSVSNNYSVSNVRTARSHDNPNTAAGRLRTLGYSGLAGRVVTVCNTDSDLAPSANKPVSAWEPLQDIVNVRQHLRRLDWSRPGLQHGCVEATRHWEDAARAAFDHRFCILERKLMEFEDTRSKVLMCDLKIKNAEDRVAAVMAFSKRKLSKFEAEEANDEEDWREAWESSEDGTAWIGLNEARKIRKALKTVAVEFGERAMAITLARENQVMLYEVQRSQREWLDAMLQWLADLEAEVRLVEQTSTVLEDLARETLTVVMSRLSMSRSCGVPSVGYRISVPILDLSYIRDPLLRNHRSMRSSWNLIRRQVRRLTAWDRCNEHYPDVKVDVFGPEHLEPPKKDNNHFMYAQRFAQGTAFRFRAISVSKDPVTGCTIVDTGMEVWKKNGADNFMSSELSVHLYPEENAYESDGYILESRFRAQVESCFPTDVVLSEDEVKELCRRFGRGAQKKSEAIVRHTMESKYDFSKSVAARRDRKMGVIIFPRRRHHLDALPPTYHGRRLKLERQEESDANRILSMMRLNPHSGRICVGLLHLIRRGKSIEKTLMNSLWYRDWLEGECPSTWTNEQAHYLHIFNDRFCLVSVRDTFGSCEIRLSFYGMDPITVTITVPLEDIVLSMLEKPFLLATFICDLIVNRYSADVVDHIVSCLDLDFPGECDKKLRRADLFGETPRLMFCANKFDRYRPVFRTHRLLCGAYFCVQILVSAADDLMILLKPPIDGQFWCHAYNGDAIPVEITVTEFRSIVLKHGRDLQRDNGYAADSTATDMRPGLVKHMSILHSSNLNQLLDFLLSRLVLDKALVQAAIRHVSGAGGVANTQPLEATKSLASSVQTDDSSDSSDDEESESKSEFVGRSSIMSSQVQGDNAYENKSSYVASLGSSILRYKDSVLEEDGPESRRATSATKKREKFIDSAGYISWASEEEDNDTDDDSIFEENFNRGRKVPMRVPGGRRITQKIIKNVIATAKLYNQWANKRHAVLPELELRSHADVFRRFFAAYSVLNDTGSKDNVSQVQSPPWKLIDASSDSTTAAGSDADRINVYEELWTTMDPLRFAPPIVPSGRDGDDASATVGIMGPITDYIPAGVGTSTYWNLRVSTSGDKRMLHLLASPADLGAGRAQAAVAHRETLQMQEEERHRKMADRAVAELLEEQSRAAVQLSVCKKIEPMAELLSRERETAQFYSSLLQNALDDVLPAIDYYFVKQALSAYKLGRDRLLIESDGLTRTEYKQKSAYDIKARSIFNDSSEMPMEKLIEQLKAVYPLRVLRSAPPLIVEALAWIQGIMDSLSTVSVESILYGAALNPAGEPSRGLHVLYQTKVKKALARPGAKQRSNDSMLLEVVMERLRKMPFCPSAKLAAVPAHDCCTAGYCPAHQRQRVTDPFRSPKAWQQLHRKPYDWEMSSMAYRDANFVERAIKGIRPKKIMDVIRRVVFVSEPSIGAMGSCIFFMHEPESSKSSVALLTSPLELPLDISGAADVDASVSPLETLPVYLAKATARRVVWRSLVSGVMSAVVAGCQKQLDKFVQQAEIKLGFHYLQTKASVEKEMYLKNLNSTTDDGSKSDSDKNRIRAAYVRGEHQGNKRIRAMGVFMPFDEDSHPVPFEVDTEEWMPTVRRFLFPGLDQVSNESAGVDRVDARPALVFIHKGFQGAAGATAAQEINARFNMRLSRWLFEMTLSMSPPDIESNVDFALPEVYGDAVVMLRQRPYEQTVSHIVAWSEKRHFELNSLREKRQKTATNRLYKRFDNFLNFRDLVYYWAARFEPAFKHIFGVVGTLKNDNMESALSYPELDSELVTIEYFRNLLANVMHHTKELTRNNVVEPEFGTLDQAFLVDTDIASGDRARGYSFGYIPVGATGNGHKYAITRQEIEETNIKVTTDKYRKFESFNYTRYMVGEQFLCFDTDQLTSAYELQPRASQILYCLLRKHCLECRTPPSFCNVPGCAGIKTAIWESQDLARDRTDDQSCMPDGSLEGGKSSLSTIGTGINSLRDTSNAVGSGYHAADMAVRNFMLHGLASALINKVFAAPRLKSSGPTAIDWGSNGDFKGKESTETPLKKKVMISSPSRVAQGSRRAWRGESIHFTMRRSGHQFRSLFRYLFSPQLSQSVSQDDYICMRRSALHRFFNETDDTVIKRLCHRAHVLQNEQIRQDNVKKKVVANTSRDIALTLPCAIVEALHASFCVSGRSRGWEEALRSDLFQLPEYESYRDADVYDPYPNEYKRMTDSSYLRCRPGLRGNQEDVETRIVDLGMLAKRAALFTSPVAEKEDADTQPMTKKAFEWLCSRLVITRRGLVFGHKFDTFYRLGKAVLLHLDDVDSSLAIPHFSQSLDRGSHHLTIDAAPATLKFDRLFSQRSFFMKSSGAATVNERRLRSLAHNDDADYLAQLRKTATVLGGTYVRIQIFYGVLNGYPSFNIPEAGCPPAATRFCHTAMLSDIGYGLTMLVYDYASEVSRALFIQGGLLLRIADALNGRHSDLADLAIRLSARAHQILVLSRVGTICTGIDLDPSSLSIPVPVPIADAQSSLKVQCEGYDEAFSVTAKHISPFSCRVRAGGSKQFAVDRRQDSIRAALDILKIRR